MKPNTYLVKKNQNQIKFHYKKKFYGIAVNYEKYNRLVKNKYQLQELIKMEHWMAQNKMLVITPKKSYLWTVGTSSMEKIPIISAGWKFPC